MRNRDEATRQRRHCFCGAIAVLAVLIGLTAPMVYAAIPDANGVIHGCYNANNGNTRIIDTATSSCRNPEVAVQWGQQGPSGPVGLTGPQGEQGPAGPQGPAGTALAYARILANGTVDTAHSSPNVVAFKHPTVGSTTGETDPGLYCIGITGGTDGMVHVAVASLDSLYNVAGTVTTGVFLASGCEGTAALGVLFYNNIYVVTRPEGQPGGQNGEDRAFYLIVN
jgi:hypothetical protein